MPRGLAFSQQRLRGGVLLVSQLPQMPLPVHDGAAVVTCDSLQSPAVGCLEQNGGSSKLAVDRRRQRRIQTIQPTLDFERERNGKRRRVAVGLGTVPQFLDRSRLAPVVGPPSAVYSRVQACSHYLGPFLPFCLGDQLVNGRWGGCFSVLESPSKIESALTSLIPQLPGIAPLTLGLDPARGTVEASVGTGLHGGEL